MGDGSYVAKLDKEPLVEIFAKIAQYEVPALVECEANGSTISIFCTDAELRYACFGEVEEAFGRSLIEHGLTDQGTYREAVERSRKTTRAIAVELTASGVDGVRMIATAREATLEAIDAALDQREGEALMTPGRYILPVRLSIPLGRVILDGVRGRGEPKELTARVGTKTTILKRTEHKAPYLNDEERALLEKVDGKTPFGEIVTRPPGPAAENVRLLYAFTLLQLIAPKTSVKVKMRVNE